MKTQSTDTHPLVEAKLVNLLKNISTSQKLSRSLTLTSLSLHLSKRAIHRVNPGKNKFELDMLFIKYHYGDDLAKEVSRYIKKMNDEKK